MEKNMKIPTLDEIVLASLDFFVKTPPPVFDVSKFSLPFVVGSGNAMNTGNILFSDRSAIFADESNFKSQVEAYTPVIQKGLITDAIIISASGEKDSTWEVNYAKQHGLKTTLLTCKPNSSAARDSDTILTYKSIAEPYTYNVSTYLGMILSTTNEKAIDIQTYIKHLQTPDRFQEYASFAFVLPDAFIHIAPMIIIKDDELFGPHVHIRAFTEGHARHAKFVHPWNKELVISLGYPNALFGDPDSRWNIPVPEKSGYGTMLALSYYLCGLIQKTKLDYFMQDITKYCTDYGPKAYGKNDVFDVIVPGNE
jgi:hypothetical protein